MGAVVTVVRLSRTAVRALGHQLVRVGDVGFVVDSVT